MLQTGAKVKASDKFGFPLALDLDAFVSPAEDGALLRRTVFMHQCMYMNI